MSPILRMEHQSIFQKLKKAREKIESPGASRRNVANTFRPVRSLLDFYIAFKRTNLCCFKSTKFSLLCHVAAETSTSGRLSCTVLRLLASLPVEIYFKSTPVTATTKALLLSRIPNLCSSKNHSLIKSFP